MRLPWSTSTLGSANSELWATGWAAHENAPDVLRTAGVATGGPSGLARAPTIGNNRTTATAVTSSRRIWTSPACSRGEWYSAGRCGRTFRDGQYRRQQDAAGHARDAPLLAEAQA